MPGYPAGCECPWIYGLSYDLRGMVADCPPKQLSLTLAGIAPGNAAAPPCLPSQVACAGGAGCAGLNTTYILDFLTAPGGYYGAWGYQFSPPLPEACCGLTWLVAFINGTTFNVWAFANTPGDPRCPPAGSGAVFRWSKNIVLPYKMAGMSIGSGAWTSFQDLFEINCGGSYYHLCDGSAATAAISAVAAELPCGACFDRS
jgi:hypothetical protein